MVSLEFYYVIQNIMQSKRILLGIFLTKIFSIPLKQYAVF